MSGCRHSPKLPLSVLQPDLHPPSPPACPTAPATAQHGREFVSLSAGSFHLRWDADGVTLWFIFSRMETHRQKTDREMARQPRHARAGTAVTASSPLHVWYPFTLPTDPPGAGSAAPEQRGRRQTEGQDRRIRNADSKAMNGPPRHGPHWPPSTDAASPRAHPPGTDEPAGSVPNHRH